ncbi:MAG: hypothetical protein ACREDH_12195 [Methylocella sp.]
MSAPNLVLLLRSRHFQYSLNGARRDLYLEDWADEWGEIFGVFRVEVRRYRPAKAERIPAHSRALNEIERKIKWHRKRSNT